MLRPRTFFVKAEWDDEAKVWYVSQTDVPGLVAEADTPDELTEKLLVLVPEMLEENGLIECEDHDLLPEVPFSLMIDQLKGKRIPC